MKRRDFFKGIPLLFIAPIMTIGMLENGKEARLSDVYEYRNGVWIQIKWPDVKKGMKLKFSHCRENTYKAVSDCYKNEENIFAINVTDINHKPFRRTS